MPCSKQYDMMVLHHKEDWCCVVSFIAWDNHKLSIYHSKVLVSPCLALERLFSP